MKKYPFRYDKGYIGQKIFITLVDEDGNYSVDEDTITEIQDNSYRIAVKDDGEWMVDDGQFVVERAKDWHNCSVGYWTEKYSSGHAGYFGEDIFETKDEAEEALQIDGE